MFKKYDTLFVTWYQMVEIFGVHTDMFQTVLDIN